MSEHENNDARLTEAQLSEITDELLGQCGREAHICDEYGIDDGELIELMLSRNVECCVVCGWWKESSEMDPDAETPPQCCECSGSEGSHD